MERRSGCYGYRACDDDTYQLCACSGGRISAAQCATECGASGDVDLDQLRSREPAYCSSPGGSPIDCRDPSSVDVDRLTSAEEARSCIAQADFGPTSPSDVSDSAPVASLDGTGVNFFSCLDGVLYGTVGAVAAVGATAAVGVAILEPTPAGEAALAASAPVIGYLGGVIGLKLSGSIEGCILPLTKIAILAALNGLSGVANGIKAVIARLTGRGQVVSFEGWYERTGRRITDGYRSRATSGSGAGCFVAEAPVTWPYGTQVPELNPVASITTPITLAKLRVFLPEAAAASALLSALCVTLDGTSAPFVCDALDVEVSAAPIEDAGKCPVWVELQGQSLDMSGPTPDPRSYRALDLESHDYIPRRPNAFAQQRLERIRTDPDYAAGYTRAHRDAIDGRSWALDNIPDAALRDRMRNLLTNFQAGRVGASLRGLNLRGRSFADIDAELRRRGFNGSEGPLWVRTDRATNESYYRLRNGGETTNPNHPDRIPQWVYTHSDGALVRVKPDGDPGGRREQPHAVAALLFDPAAGTGWENEAFKVGSGGQPIPKIPAGAAGLRTVDANRNAGYGDGWADFAHQDL